MWQEAQFRTADGITHAYYHLGEGVPLLWINGGPGDSHNSLRVVARGMSNRLMCVLYDQRGCGQTSLPEINADTLHIARLSDDIEALRQHLGVAQLHIIGHSWGAMLTLAYAATYPEHVAAMALIAPGPFTPEFARVVKTNISARFNRNQRYVFDMLRSQRKMAAINRDNPLQKKLHIRLMHEFYAPTWVYTPEKAIQYARDFEMQYNINPYLTEYLMPSWYALDILSIIDGLATPTLVMYGYQDPQVITQAYMLAQRLVNARVVLLDECGHLPWLDQPERFYAEIDLFFQGVG